MSIVCESFGCLPSQAIREIQEGPADLVWRILDMRAFARTKEQMDEARKNPRASVEIGPEQQLVEEIGNLADLEMLREIRAARGC